MKSIIVLTIVSLLATGCATVGGYQESMQTWVGADADRLVMAWGAPSSTFQLGNGNKMLSYSNGGGMVGMTTYNPYTKSSFTTMGQTSCKTNFEVDTANVVRNYSFSGNACMAIPSGGHEAKRAVADTHPNQFHEAEPDPFHQGL